MISTGQIIAAGAVTGVAVAVAAWRVHWRLPWLLAAAIGALVLIAGWRAVSNLLNLNGDFLPAVSVGDAGCLFLGAVAPAVAGARAGGPPRLRWVPAVAGGLAGFVVNVVIL